MNNSCLHNVKRGSLPEALSVTDCPWWLCQTAALIFSLRPSRFPNETRAPYSVTSA